MTPCSEGFSMTRFPPMTGTPQFPIYVQPPPPPPPPPPPLHESYAYNRTYPPQAMPTFHRPDIAQLKSYVDSLFLSQEHRIEACERRIARLENEKLQMKFQLERSSGEEGSSIPANATTERSSTPVHNTAETSIAPINFTEGSNAPINLIVESRTTENPTTERPSALVNSTGGSNAPISLLTERSTAPMNPITAESGPVGFDPLNDETLTQPSGRVKESPIVDSTEDSEADSLHTRPQIYEEVPIVPLPLDPIKPPKGQLYLMGGLDRNGKMNRTVEVLDEGSMLWTRVSEIPMDLHCVHSSAVVLEPGQVFILTSFPTVYQNFKVSFISGELDHWCVVSSERRQPSCLGSFAPLNGKICSIGGYHCTTPVLWSSSPIPFPPDLSVLSVSSTVQIYDPNRDVWDQLQSLSTGKIRPNLVPSEPHVLYSLGGLVSDNNCLHPTNEVERFDIREGTWKKLDPMGQPRAFFNAIGTGYNFVAMGGISAPFCSNGCSAIDATNTVETYDLRKNMWIPEKPLVRERCAFTSHLLKNDEIYILGGQYKLTLKPDQLIHVLDTEKYYLKDKGPESGMCTGIDGERSAHVSFLLE